MAEPIGSTKFYPFPQKILPQDLGLIVPRPVIMLATTRGSITHFNILISSSPGNLSRTTTRSSEYGETVLYTITPEGFNSSLSVVTRAG